MIKLNISLLMGLSLAGIALTSTPVFSQSSPTGKGAFQCDTVSGKLTTFAYNAKTQEKIPFIHWESGYLQDIATDTACQNSANTLNEYSNSGKREFKILIDGTNFGSQTAVCLINQPGECNQRDNKVFFTLKSEGPLDEILPKIIDPNLAYLDPKKLNEPVFRAIGRIYYPEIKQRTLLDKIFGN